MDKTRTLPPLVRGKVAGILNLFVDEIRLFRNILSDNFDLVLQVQWWGECLPAFIRPRILQVQGRNYKNSHSLECYNHFAKYEIKTTLDLFMTYLKSCERVEFCVFEGSKKCIIGSAFLKEVISLLNKNNEPITIPVFNYLGLIIGEVTIYINFLEKPQQECEKSQGEIILNDKKSYRDEELEKIRGEKISRMLKSDCFITAEKTLFYDQYIKKSSNTEGHFMQLESSTDKYDSKKNKHIINSDSTQLFSSDNCLFSNQEINMNHKPESANKESYYKHLPEIKNSNDSSKVLCFNVSSQQSNPEINIKSNSTKIISKFNSNSIKCKSKSKSIKSNFSSDQNLCNKKLITKKFETSKSLPKKAIKVSKNQFDNTDSTLVKNIKSGIVPCFKRTDLQSVTSKETCNYNVLDYLLGSDMSKTDEEIALNNFKKMSPSHNLVDSISQLCLDSDTSKSGSCAESVLVSLKPSHLNFDFNNPIERNYYEKFFFKSNCNADFEVAEFLNQPKNRIMLEKLKCNEISQKNGSERNNLENATESVYHDREIKETKFKQNLSVNNICIGNKTNNCARCKYYKKLNELDAIIESLKHFEQKMHMHDKHLQLDFKQNPDMLIKKNVS